MIEKYYVLEQHWFVGIIHPYCQPKNLNYNFLPPHSMIYKKKLLQKTHHATLFRSCQSKFSLLLPDSLGKMNQFYVFNLLCLSITFCTHLFKCILYQHVQCLTCNFALLQTKYPVLRFKLSESVAAQPFWKFALITYFCNIFPPAHLFSETQRFFWAVYIFLFNIIWCYFSFDLILYNMNVLSDRLSTLWENFAFLYCTKYYTLLAYG